MPFPLLVKQQALARSRGRCECTRLMHSHSGRCPIGVNMGSEFHHRTAQRMPSSNDSLSNCEVLCVSCHRQTESYGRS